VAQLIVVNGLQHKTGIPDGRVDARRDQHPVKVEAALVGGRAGALFPKQRMRAGARDAFEKRLERPECLAGGNAALQDEVGLGPVIFEVVDSVVENDAKRLRPLV
jgi:hypothetical protein